MLPPSNRQGTMTTADGLLVALLDHRIRNELKIIFAEGASAELEKRDKKIAELELKVTQLESELENVNGSSDISTATRAKVSKRRLDAGITDSAAVGNSKQKKSKNDVTSAATIDSDGDLDYVIVYTDGCCHNNGKKTPNAGIGVFWGKKNKWNASERLKGRQTNNRAEIHAAIKAIRQAKERGIKNLDIHTDSNFLIKSITTWIKGWRKKGWKTAAGTNVLNKSDFEELDAELTGINVKWTHVRGHQGIEGNEMADKLANKGAVQPYIFPKDDDWF